jgi:hypothetical protein
MNNSYHTGAVLQADISNKLNNLQQQASTQRLLLKVPRTTSSHSQIWKAVWQAMIGFWQLESSTRSSQEAKA